jgi:hypothetical protein
VQAGNREAESGLTWPIKLRAARDETKQSRNATARRLVNTQGIQITAEAIKKHEAGTSQPKSAYRKAYAAYYKIDESVLFPESEITR